MSAETLRRSATAIREDYSAAETDNGEDDPFMFAVADWLDNCADRWRYGPSSPEKAHATVIANAYLGEPA